MNDEPEDFEEPEENEEVDIEEAPEIQYLEPGAVYAFPLVDGVDTSFGILFGDTFLKLESAFVLGDIERSAFRISAQFVRGDRHLSGIDSLVIEEHVNES